MLQKIRHIFYIILTVTILPMAAVESIAIDRSNLPALPKQSNYIKPKLPTCKSVKREANNSAEKQLLRGSMFVCSMVVNQRVQ